MNKDILQNIKRSRITKLQILISGLKNNGKNLSFRYFENIYLKQLYIESNSEILAIAERSNDKYFLLFTNCGHNEIIEEIDIIYNSLNIDYFEFKFIRYSDKVKHYNVFNDVGKYVSFEVALKLIEHI